MGRKMGRTTTGYCKCDCIMRDLSHMVLFSPPALFFYQQVAKTFYTHRILIILVYPQKIFNILFKNLKIVRILGMVKCDRQRIKISLQSFVRGRSQDLQHLIQVYPFIPIRSPKTSDMLSELFFYTYGRR